MKQNMMKKLAVFVLVTLVLATCIPLSGSAALTNADSYVKTGLKACYVGNNNKGGSHDVNATVWKDLSGNGYDITVPVDANNKFTATGLKIDSQRVNVATDTLNKALIGVVNGDQFTIEINLGDIVSKGTNWNTFVNSTNDSISLFRTVTADTLVFKNQNSGSQVNQRPTANDGLNLFKDSTISVTFKHGGKVTVYVDGVKVDDKDATYKMNIDDLFIGHDVNTKNYQTEYRALRIYNVELTAAQVKQNSDADKAMIAGGNGGGGEPSESSEETSSNSTSSSTTTTTSTSTSTAVSSDSSATSSPQTSDTSYGQYIIYAAAALAAIAVTVFIVRNRKMAK